MASMNGCKLISMLTTQHISTACTMVFCNYFSDLTDGSSFERAKFWVEELLKNEEVIIKLYPFVLRVPFSMIQLGVVVIKAQ